MNITFLTPCARGHGAAGCGPRRTRALRSGLAITGLCMAILLASARGEPARAAVSASSIHAPDYAPEHAVDGSLRTRWASGRFSERPEWLAIDFGRPVEVDGLVIHWEAAYAKAYELQVSDDGAAWRTVYRQDEGTGGREKVDGLAARGSHLRVLCLRPGPHPLFSLWQIEFTGSETARALEEVRRRARALPRLRLQPVFDVLRAQGVEEIVFALRQRGRDDHWYANFGYFADSTSRLPYGPGGKLCRMIIDSGAVTVLLDDPEGTVRDPAVHYDAQKILFSYRKGDSPYFHLYEIGIDGENLRQLTDGPHDDIEPSYLPDGRIVFVSSRANRWVQCWLTQVAVLYACEADGSGIRPLSANVEHDNTPWPLPDGRILYTRWEYIDRSQVDYHHLWTMNPDGTAQMVYYGNLHPGQLMIGAKPVPDSRMVVATFSPGHGQRDHIGRIMLVDPRRGPDHPGSAREITREMTFRDPWAFSERSFMAARGRSIVLLDDQGQTLDLFTVRPEEAEAGLECFEPRPLVARRREHVIPDRTDPRQAYGRAMLMDIHEGRNMEGIERGEIKRLLVLESLPKPINYTGGMDPISYGGTFTLPRVLGTVPVEPDGSAYMELPALRSLFFVALDKDAMAVKRMHSFMTVQPGETVGCIGCHEHRTYVPPASTLPLAMQRGPQPIEPLSGFPDVYDFPRDVQPVLDALCGDCHGLERTARGGPYAGSLLLTGDRGPMFSHAYFNMTVRRLFSDNRNRAVSNLPPRAVGSPASRILGMLDGTHHGVKADERQKTILRLWIDSGAPYPGTYAALGGGSIGGYFENRQVVTDHDWPTMRPAAETIHRRCASCHQGDMALPRALSDERNVSFWRFAIDDPRLRLSRHIVFNLTRPEKSMLLLAPLAREAGGLARCRDAGGQPAVVFADTSDPDYGRLLEMVKAGKRKLEEITRFDMPGFRPPAPYLREMRRYGILPPDHGDDDPVDPYALDRRYWDSFRHVPREAW